MSTDKLELPKQAIERLAGVRRKDGGRNIFTSDLSVNEYFCVRKAGFEPLGLVMGSSVYHIGFQKRRWGKNMELDVLTQAMYHARELAIERMKKEADALQADGIVGVKLQINRRAWGSRNAEFVAIGTAVKSTDESKNFLNNRREPFTSDLSGQDFWTLLQAGYRPLSLSLGSCVYHVAHQRLGKLLSRFGRNIELTHYTQALYDARELAMERMQQEAQNEEAEGIVGVHIHEGCYGWSQNVIEFFAVGTAVTPMAEESNFNNIKAPEMVLSLNDK